MPLKAEVYDHRFCSTVAVGHSHSALTERRYNAEKRGAL